MHMLLTMLGLDKLHQDVILSKTDPAGLNGQENCREFLKLRIVPKKEGLATPLFLNDGSPVVPAGF